MMSVKNITLDNNIVSHIYERAGLTGDTFIDPRAAITICALEGGNKCSDIRVINNIVAGAAYAGFIIMGHDCGNYNQDIFKNNIAHSIEGYKGGMGAVIYPDPMKSSHSTCFEGSYFTAYKCKL